MPNISFVFELNVKAAMIASNHKSRNRCRGTILQVSNLNWLLVAVALLSHHEVNCSKSKEEDLKEQGEIPNLVFDMHNMLSHGPVNTHSMNSSASKFLKLNISL